MLAQKEISSLSFNRHPIKFILGSIPNILFEYSKKEKAVCANYRKG
jgi:hypothetical protein